MLCLMRTEYSVRLKTTILITLDAPAEFGGDTPGAQSTTSKPPSNRHEFTLDNVEALIIRIGFGGPLYSNYKKEPPKIV